MVQNIVIVRRFMSLVSFAKLIHKELIVQTKPNQKKNLCIITDLLGRYC